MERGRVRDKSAGTRESGRSKKATSFLPEQKVYGMGEASPLKTDLRRTPFQGGRVTRKEQHATSILFAHPLGDPQGREVPEGESGRYTQVRGRVQTVGVGSGDLDRGSPPTREAGVEEGVGEETTKEEGTEV